MSKYIIEIPDDVQYVLLNGQTDHKCYTAVRPVAELEELNSDYINEHYGSLQDEAYQKGYAEAERIWRAPSSDNEFYQKGFEDGKNSTDMGCEGCRYTSKKSHEEPCFSCTRNHTDQYTPMPKEDDSIKVGDEVKAPRGKAVVTAVKDDLVHYFYSGGDYGCIEPYHLTKTGKHYDIQSILEAMRE